MTKKFLKDVCIGEKYELKALKHLVYDSYEQSKGKFSDWDLKLKHDGKETTYEVKADFMSYKSGKVAIEYECNKKPSGIYSSKADFYILCLIHPKGGEKVLKIPIEELRRRKDEYKGIMCGDGKKQMLFIADT